MRKHIERILETRALPVLEEKRNNLIEEMEGLVNKAKEETRAFSDEENTRYEAIKAEIAGIDKVLSAEEETRTFEKKTETKEKKEETRTQEEIDNEELRFILGGKVAENRATAMNTATNADGGHVISKTLSKEILKVLKDRCDVMAFFNSTSINGTLRIPKKAGNGTASWKDEQLTPNATSDATTPTLDILELGQNRLYRESAITQQMLNTEELDLRSFIIDDISQTMADAIEDAVFNGDGSKKPTGILSGINTNKKITLATRGTITFDEIKKTKGLLKREAQKGASWFMCQDTFTAIDLLKDGEGRYLLQPDPTQPSGYTMLGLPIIITDAMPLMSKAGSNCLIMLANPKAYHINLQKQLAMYVYDDSAYKRAGLTGYAADIYLDGKVKDDQFVAGLYNKAS